MIMNIDNELLELLEDDEDYTYMFDSMYGQHIIRDYICQIDPELQIVTDANSLITAFDKAKKASMWKQSTQHYEANRLKETCKLKREVKTNTYKQRVFRIFVINERGKTRYIRALDVRDRVIQRALCDEILTLRVQPHLIYDNGASVKFKGQAFTEKRVVAHLQKYFRKHGTKGYVLKLDFSKFFDNVIHEVLIQQLAKIIQSESTINLCKILISSFDVDVSYMTDDEFKNCYNTLYNSLEHIKRDPSTLDFTKIMHKSIGIGSQISQICGLLYLSYDVDHYCKCCEHLEFYGRYADDLYIMDESKERLIYIFNNINARISARLGLFINMDKTQIINLSQGFVFLKIHYKLEPTGKVLKIPSKSKINRERQKLPKFAKMIEEGKLTYKEVNDAYKSWRGTMTHYDCHNALIRTDEFYFKVFGRQWNE